jgi:hypothetical protein
MNVEAAVFPPVRVTNFQTTLCHNLENHDINNDLKDSYFLKCTHCWCVIFPDSLPTVGNQKGSYGVAQAKVISCLNSLSLRSCGRFILPKNGISEEEGRKKWLCVHLSFLCIIPLLQVLCKLCVHTSYLCCIVFCVVHSYFIQVGYCF